MQRVMIQIFYNSCSRILSRLTVQGSSLYTKKHHENHDLSLWNVFRNHTIVIFLFKAKDIMPTYVCDNNFFCKHLFFRFTLLVQNMPMLKLGNLQLWMGKSNAIRMVKRLDTLSSCLPLKNLLQGKSVLHSRYISESLLDGKLINS